MEGNIFMSKICGIYIIKNTINDKVYIGQSVNIQARWYAHCASARSDRQDSYTEIHQAMKNLGVKNFYYEVLEECDISELNKREIYYIQCYDSYKNGYNMTLGGESNRYETNGRAILTLPQVEEIRLMYDAHIPFREAYSRYEKIISKRGFRKVWHYETWLGILPEVYSDENKQWHATYAKANIKGNTHLGENNTERQCSQEEINKMRELRSQGLSYEKISKEVNRATSVVRKYCLHREATSSQAHGNQQPNAISVRNIETGLVFDSLRQAAKWANIKDGGKHIREIVFQENPKYKISGKVPSTNEPAHWELA